MQTPTIAAVGDKIEHELMPGFTMTVQDVGTCEVDSVRHEPHKWYQITDPEGNTDWLCGYDVKRVG